MQEISTERNILRVKKRKEKYNNRIRERSFTDIKEMLDEYEDLRKKEGMTIKRFCEIK